MVLSKREKYVAIGTLSALFIYGFDYYALSPYIAKRHKLDEDTTLMLNKVKQADVLFARESKLREIWAEMQKGGLKVQYSEAEIQALKAVLDLAQEAGVAIVDLKQERPLIDGKFEIIIYHCQATGAMRHISKFFWALETATIPLKVNDVQFAPRGKEGLDDLSVQMSISTLCMPPELDKTKTTVTLAGTKGFGHD